MPKYITQLRRGTKEHWQDYEQTDPVNSVPLAGELVVEFDNGVPRLKIGDGTTPYSSLPYMSVDSFILPTQATIAIDPDKWMQVDSDGYIIDSEGNALGADGTVVEEEYYDVDGSGSIIDPNGKIIANRYVQFVTVSNATITQNSKVDINLSPSDLATFRDKDLAFTTINAGGQVRVCIVGQKPVNQYTFKVTVTEVV